MQHPHIYKPQIHRTVYIIIVTTDVISILLTHIQQCMNEWPTMIKMAASFSAIYYVSQSLCDIL